jgi:hypothetical protein
VEEALCCCPRFRGLVLTFTSDRTCNKLFWFGIEVGTPDVDVDFSQLLVLRL